MEIPRHQVLRCKSPKSTWIAKGEALVSELAFFHVYILWIGNLPASVFIHWENNSFMLRAYWSRIYLIIGRNCPESLPRRSQISCFVQAEMFLNLDGFALFLLRTFQHGGGLSGISLALFIETRLAAFGGNWCACLFQKGWSDSFGI